MSFFPFISNQPAATTLNMAKNTAAVLFVISFDYEAFIQGKKKKEKKLKRPKAKNSKIQVLGH